MGGKASTPEEIPGRRFRALAKQKTRRENFMKKLLLIGLAVSGLAFVPGQRSDAQPTVLVPRPEGL
jgi:hypothetical protein